MKNILLILVGGTICSAKNAEGNLSVSEETGIILKSNFERSNSEFAKRVNIDLSRNLFILSENMTVSKWNLILETFREYYSLKKHDGIIIAHGTDTLAYSASLFSQILCGLNIPVFLVSANENLFSKRSNGNDNFRIAVELICNGITPNIYVAYKNLSDSQMYLHISSRLLQCPNYSEDFHSVGEINITDMKKENRAEYLEKIESVYPKNLKNPIIDIFGNWKLKNCVLMIDSYVGVDYSAFDYKKFKSVLVNAYHSGTGCAEDEKNYSENSILYMIDRCSENGVDTYFSPSILKEGTYETVSVIANHISNGKKIKFFYGLTKETAYIKLLIAYSVFDDENERNRFLETQCNFENIY